MRSVEHFCNIANRHYGTIAAPGEDGFEVAFEEGAGVAEVPFGVGRGDGEAVKCLVEDADDAMLFGEGLEGIRTTSRIPEAVPS
jgi:hypothetical protein